MLFPSGLHYAIFAVLASCTCLALLTLPPYPLNAASLIIFVASFIIYCGINDHRRSLAERGKHDLGHFSVDLSERALDSLVKDLAKTKKL